MWLITFCLLAGHPCQDQIRYGMFMTKDECIARVNTPDVMRRLDKYRGKVMYKCQEIWVGK